MALALALFRQERLTLAQSSRLRELLDPGEAEAIVLAVERRGRRTAAAAGLIELGKPVVDELIERSAQGGTGFTISPSGAGEVGY